MKKVKRKLHIDGFVKIEFRIIFVIIAGSEAQNRYHDITSISP